VRRLTAWLAGAAGGLAAYRALARRRLPLREAVPPEPGPDERAEELRERLARAREAAPAEEAELEGLDARRRAVHDEARAAIDEMRGE
jgi:hypothetical protein